jgi:hypothetical protein
MKKNLLPSRFPSATEEQQQVERVEGVGPAKSPSRQSVPG